MRIIAGEYRGRRLAAPKGRGTRPTTDRVRESLMSALVSARGRFEGAVVLDLFAGSGALGLEALSRGAHFACFCERDSTAFRTLKTNVGELGIDQQRVHLQRLDVFERAIFRFSAPYDLVFLDPPYVVEPDKIGACMRRFADEGLISSHAFFAYEHAAGSDMAADEAFVQHGLSLMSRRTYGDTTLDIATLSFCAG